MQQSTPHPPTPDILILAAGLGTRMKSAKAKVLHELDGRPLIEHVCRIALPLQPRMVHVVVGYQANEVELAIRRCVPPELVSIVNQAQQRGTGDAVMAARDRLQQNTSPVLVLTGDVPLIRAETLRALLDQHRSTGAACSLISTRLENPTGYGRVIRDSAGGFSKIVEQKDASEQEREIKEINAGFYCFDPPKLFQALEQVQPTNAQGEYYLTDVPGILLANGERVEIYLHKDARELSGINTRAELSEFENLLRRRTVRRLMTEVGVTFIDPSSAYISSDAQFGRDCVVHPDVTVEGPSVIGENCVIRSGTRIANSRIGDNVVIKDHCVIVDSHVDASCSIGPFAHLRMNAHVKEGGAVGNFVEMKKSTLGRRSKSMHLTYLGDATVGDNTNIGAGTVTCNYDGRQKHPTVIEDDVRIGSDTMLVAPVTVGKGSVTGAGSVVTKDVPPDSLVAGVPAVVKKKLK
ncbi:MAG TPA: bifunctional UDP-N-acetylglucosamine diphosphorylase/glucosamine-1-phosphate N-acetyltransferase GlmU [Pyrinomonadaceae bacterium]|nr:bifunctional UDP-N-acetylglucosamine diphosphorylase/glucosamine-1-phosphate N-acetyltransferase GlmU [Pyrinomonadaceae bacterium]